MSWDWKTKGRVDPRGCFGVVAVEAAARTISPGIRLLQPLDVVLQHPCYDLETRCM